MGALISIRASAGSGELNRPSLGPARRPFGTVAIKETTEAGTTVTARQRGRGRINVKVRES